MRADPDPSRFRDLMLEGEPGFEEVMRCVFGIRTHEAKLYLELLEIPNSTIAELADRIDRDRSNVNRGCTTLLEKGLVDRHRRLLDSGGHVYQYRPTPPDEVRELMHETLNEWTAYVHERIEEFPENR